MPPQAGPSFKRDNQTIQRNADEENTIEIRYSMMMVPVMACGAMIVAIALAVIMAVIMAMIVRMRLGFHRSTIFYR
jgi:hypothetical protein